MSVEGSPGCVDSSSKIDLSMVETAYFLWGQRFLHFQNGSPTYIMIPTKFPNPEYFQTKVCLLFLSNIT